MAEPFLAEIRIMSFQFAPKGWAMCNGQLLPTSQNTELYSLLGTTFGGDGLHTFALPDFRARVPISVGGGHDLGASGGEAAHTLSTGEMPKHAHLVNATEDVGSSQSGEGNLLGVVGVRLYTDLANPTTIHPSTISETGNGQAHNNMQPFLTLNFCISLQGEYPVGDARGVYQ